MKITNDERHAFGLAGTVAWDPARQILRWTWQPHVHFGSVVYLMLVDGDVKKGGKAEDTPSSTFKKRMQSEFAKARQVIVGPIPGRPLPGWRSRKFDPFTKYAPPVLVAGHTVELWAKSFPNQSLMKAEETRLNLKYRGEWTEQGWTRDGRRIHADGE